MKIVLIQFGNSKRRKVNQSDLSLFHNCIKMIFRYFGSVSKWFRGHFASGSNWIPWTKLCHITCQIFIIRSESKFWYPNLYLWAIDFSMFLCNISNLWPGSMQHSFIILLKLFVSFLKSFKFSWIFEYFCSRRPLARIAPSWVRDCSNLPNYFRWWFASGVSQSEKSMILKNDLRLAWIEFSASFIKSLFCFL